MQSDCLGEQVTARISQDALKHPVLTVVILGAPVAIALAPEAGVIVNGLLPTLAPIAGKVCPAP